MLYHSDYTNVVTRGRDFEVHYVVLRDDFSVSLERNFLVALYNKKFDDRNITVSEEN